MPGESEGTFRTPTLRGVALTAPYTHAGQLKTLKEVVQFYNDGGAADSFSGTKDPLIVPLNLTEQEVDDLVAFMESLTGDPVPEALTQDISKP
ncbi:MAG: c-type cytochrome [Myxococcaceae bacterium]|nr:c-type cytochrome [Myxococcaceae bacterium]